MEKVKIQNESDTKFEEYDSEVGKLELFAIISKQLAKFKLLSVERY